MRTRGTRKCEKRRRVECKKNRIENTC